MERYHERMDWKYFLGIVGAAAAWIWSVYTWHRSQAAQRAQNEYTRKEGLYRELLRTMTVLYKGGPQTGVGPFTEQYRLSWLYAPDDVVRILNSLTESLTIDPAEAHMPPEQRQVNAQNRDKSGAKHLALLVAAIRRDLFETAGRKTELTDVDVRHYS